MVFYNFCYYFWGQHCCWTETSIRIGNRFCSLQVCIALNLFAAPYRCSDVLCVTTDHFKINTADHLLVFNSQMLRCLSVINTKTQTNRSKSNRNVLLTLWTKNLKDTHIRRVFGCSVILNKNDTNEARTQTTAPLKPFSKTRVTKPSALQGLCRHREAKHHQRGNPTLSWMTFQTEV